MVHGSLCHVEIGLKMSKYGVVRNNHKLNWAVDTSCTGC